MLRDAKFKCEMVELVIDRRKASMELSEIISDLCKAKMELSNGKLSKEDGEILLDKMIQGMARLMKSLIDTILLRFVKVSETSLKGSLFFLFYIPIPPLFISLPPPFEDFSASTSIRVSSASLFISSIGKNEL